ncbi:MAG: tetratricopeptide repeat protein [Anaerolineaceae bacterium]|nr:tetratricopeptide repeat protein [Anaerolineaceae bacterium]
MAKIPLRSYIQEIEGLIDRGQTDEAIAHCKHILRYYPKHIDTYRMLGKAYLESQRYSEASDVLHRVLSVFPDDFVSQIGMSIIREDEGNLDAAIWHMERTFEVQPANTAVQDELRRLYGRRDGVEPPKVRLTRGALARLYARGELFPQAIAEIRAALAEDPERVDLEVILAQTYFASGQKIEATETCSRLVSKLPYCYEANRLLAEILPGTSRSDDAKIYQQRIFALDPYAAYTSPGAPANSQVPDNAVTLDHLDWQPPQENTQQQPEWAKTVGIDLGETEEPLPDWLTPMPNAPTEITTEEGSNAAAPVGVPASTDSSKNNDSESNPPSDDQQIPDWMKSAGWSESESGEAELPPAPESKFVEEIAPADIPDWLQSFAPADISEQEPQIPEEQQKLDMLDKILPSQSVEAAVAQSAPADEIPPEVQNEADRGITQPVATITAPSEAFVGQQVESATSDETLPDWLQGLGIDGNFNGKELTGDQTMPDWMQPVSETTKEIEAQKDGTLPDWMQSKAEPVQEFGSETAGPLPDWMQPSNEPTNEPIAAPSEPVPDWLVDFAAEQKSTVSETTSPSDELPDWIKPTDVEKPIEELPSEQLNSISETELQSEPLNTTQEPAATGVTSAGDDVDAAMAWLESLAAKQGADEGTLTTSSNALNDTPPEWVQREMESNANNSIQTPALENQPGQNMEEPASVAQPVEAIESKNSETIEPLIGTIASLAPAAENNESEQTEPVINETEAVTLQPISAEETALDSQPAEQIENAAFETEMPSEELAASEKPSMAAAAESFITAEASAPVVQDSQEVPVVEDLQEASVPITAEAQTEIAPNSTLTDENIDQTQQISDQSQPTPFQLEQPERPAVEQPPEPFAASEDISAGPVVQEQKSVVEQPLEAVSSQPDLSADDGFAWLEALAAKHGADEGTLIMAPQDRTETPPAWISQANTAPLEELPASDQTLESLRESVNEPVPTKPASLGNGLPDWLQSDEFIEQEENIEPALQESQPADGGLPDWLKEIEAEQPAAAPVETPIEETPPQPEPDWLHRLNPEPETPVTTVGAQSVEKIKVEEDLHEWLESLDNQPNAEPEIPLTENAAVEQTPLPEWLQGLDETSPHSLETMPDIDKSEEVPVWVNELDNVSGEDSKLGATKPLLFPTEVEDLEPQGSFEISPESSKTQPSEQSEFEVPPVPANLMEASQPSIPASDNATVLSQAQVALDKGKLKEALEAYNQLISSGSQLDETIHDLRDALYRYPVDIGLWQALGDAYVRGNHLQDALDAYTKAEELLR